MIVIIITAVIIIIVTIIFIFVATIYKHDKYFVLYVLKDY